MRGGAPLLAAVAALATASWSVPEARAASEGPPTASWSANLNADCEPDDFVDSFRARFSPEDFWIKEKRQFESRLKGGLDGIEHSKFLLLDNKEGRGEFYDKVRARAEELGYSGEALQRMIKENMAEYDRLAGVFEQKLVDLRKELVWTRKCLQRIDTELRALGIDPQGLPPRTF